MARGPRRIALCAVLAALSSSCDGLAPLRPSDASPGDGEIIRGCPSLRAPQALPGDDIGGDTWSTWARDDFFAVYCTRCHSVANVTAVERNDAPIGYDWDDMGSVYTHLDEIRDAVGVFNYMPVEDPKPTCDERLRLVRWIDAAAPE